MAEYVGKSLWLLFGGVRYDAHYRSFKPSEEAGMVDGSAGSDTYDVYYATRSKGTASAEFVAQDGTAGTAMWAALAPNTTGTLEWAPEGSAVGRPRRYVTAVITKREENLKYDDVNMWTVEWAYNNPTGPTYTAY